MKGQGLDPDTLSVNILTTVQTAAM